MKVFLDANILVSVLNKEYPLFTYTSRIVSLVDSPAFEVYTSPLCLAIAYYFAEKKSGRSLANRKMNLLCQKLKVTTIDHQVVVETIKNKAIEDFEDGLEYYSAVNSGCQCIVTEDIDDFYFSKIEVLSSKDFLKNFAFKS